MRVLATTDTNESMAAMMKRQHTLLNSDQRIAYTEAFFSQ